MALGALLGGVALGYLLQVATPLRVEFDSTEYLVLAGWIADGNGYPRGASFPPGLPFLIAALDWLGIAQSWGIVLMNCSFLAIGMTSFARVVRRDVGWGAEGVLAAVVATLLATGLLRWASHPLSEPVFVGISLLALALASEARRRRRLAFLVLAAVVTLAAIATRTIGVALIPALVAGLPHARQRRIAVPIVAAVGGVGLALLGPTRYFGEALDEWRADPLGQASGQTGDLLRSLGEVFVNVPHDRAPDGLGAVYFVAGLGVLALVVRGAWLLRGRAPVLVTYLTSFAAVLALWPLLDPRLLLPIVPVLGVCAVVATLDLHRVARWIGLVWISGYAAVGAVALVVTTGISFSGDRFPERYGDDSVPMRATYRVALGVGSARDEADALPRTLWALRRFESRAIGDPGPVPRP